MVAKSTPKAAALAQWREMEPGTDPLPNMNPVPYKAKGSRYGACGIRIDGNPEFIDAVLSNLKSLIDGENHVTRLELARRTVERVEINGESKSFENADNGAEVCYVRLHMRGGEGAIASGIFDRSLDGATERFAAVQR